MKKKTILFFTGARSEFELQLPVIRKLNQSKNFNVILLVSGMHLNKKYSNDLSRIEDEIDLKIHKVKLPNNNTDLFSNARVIGSAIKKITEKLEGLKPDIVIIYGDRFESFAAMIAASQSGIFTCHLEGGDITNGYTFDDNVRHAMSKLANYHFTTNKNSSDILKQLGENDKLIKLVGLPVNDFIYSKDYTSKNEVIQTYKLKNFDKVVIFTFHPEPLLLEQLQDKLNRIDEVFTYMFKKYDDMKIIASYPNGDVGSDIIIQKLKEWDLKFSNLVLTKQLGNKNLHGLFDLKNSSGKKVVFLGNSSSGLKETPYFNCPNISLGTRQAGRVHAQNSIRLKLSVNLIKKSLNEIFFNYENNEYSNKIVNPYYFGNVSNSILKTINNFDIESLRRDKIFVQR